MTSTESESNVYESDDSINMYLGLHYCTSGKSEGMSPILQHDHSPVHALRFPQRVARLLSNLHPQPTNHRALDIGCAVGGSSFELAKKFDHVDAFDYSQSFVAAAMRMQQGESISFRVPVEADLFEEVKAVHEDEITPEVRSRVKFFRGDACNIKGMVSDGTVGSYDGVIMSNLLCRLQDPMACLHGIGGVVNKGGVVVIVTPFSWLTEFTPRTNWLGGFYDPDSQEPVESKVILKKVMEEQGFEKIHEEEMPLIIREHQRKYQYIVSEATGWRRK
jgi:putative 4-mercaptohistidine N1-methyltranferase